MRVELHGDPPSTVHETLSQAGLVISPGSDSLQLVWPDEAGRSALAALTERGMLALAIIDDDSQLLDAVLAGAAGVVSGTDPQRLRLELECHLRLRLRLLGRVASPEQRERAEGYELLLKISPYPIISADMRGRVTTFNPMASEILGYSSEYATAQLHVADIYANPTDARRVLSEIRTSPEHLLHDFPVRLRARSGAHIAVLLTATEVRADSGDLQATLGAFRDLRVEQALRSRLKEATEQLIYSEQRASTVSIAKAAAHELNQPLTALMGALELIDLRSDLPEDIRRRLDRMYAQLDRMADIVRSLGQQTLLESASRD
jgi:PAS domain S-box-containing protein